MCFISGNRSIIALAALIIAAGGAEARQESLEPIDAYTSAWPPYVQAHADAPGPITDIVRTVFDDMGYEVRVRRFSFAYVYDKVERGQARAAFPFFETEDRIGEVLFSDPLFEVTSRIYYSKRAHPDRPPRLTGDEVFGNVSRYRFGGEIDSVLAEAEAEERVISFDTEAEALAALIDNRIGLLPMTDRVAREVLEREFAAQRALIAPMEGFDPPQPLKVVFPLGEEALRDAFNASLARLRERALIPVGDRRTETLEACSTVAVIVASDDLPLVTATKPGAEEETYALPQGSKVAVCEWSASLRARADDDRFFAIMNDTSRILVLDGPQAGRVLNVKNIHLAIAE